MKLRTSLGYPLMAFTFGLGVTSCGDSGGSTPTPTDTSSTQTSNTTATSVAPSGTSVSPTATTSVSTTSPTTSVTQPSSDTSEPTPSGSVDTSSGETSTLPPCEVPSLSVFTRSDTEASWDDNDFSTVVLDAAGCPPGVFVDATWPHEAGWENADPSEANREQTRFTLDSYSSGDLTNKEITATVELVDDQRGPNATAGGYIVSLVSVSSFDRIVVVDPVVDPVVPTEAGALSETTALADTSAPTGVVADAGSDTGAVDAAPQTITETGYTEAESTPEERITLRHVGDRATVRFTLPAKTAAVDSYDPSRAIKVNLRFYNMFTAAVTEESVTLEEGLDAGADASLPDTLGEGEPAEVYDYLTSRFAITKFTITDVAPTP